MYQDILMFTCSQLTKFGFINAIGRCDSKRILNFNNEHQQNSILLQFFFIIENEFYIQLIGVGYISSSQE